MRERPCQEPPNGGDKIRHYTGVVFSWLWSKVKGTLVTILSFVTGWVIVSYFLRHWDRIRTGTVTKVAGLIAFVRGMPGRILGALSSLGNLLHSKGVAVVQGLWRGISSMGGWLRGQLMSFARNMIPGPIAKALGISSPSKVTTEQGKWIARGLAVGLTGSAKQVRSAADRVAGIIRKSLAPGKARAYALAKVSSGSKQLTALANHEVRLAARMKTATKALSDQIKARNALAAEVRKGILDSANITSTGAGEPVTPQTILAQLTAKMNLAKKFAGQLATLRKKGVRSDLIAQIAQAGAEQGSAAATALSLASKGEISQINKTQGQLVGAATSAGNTAGNAMYGAGIHAAQGLVKGLASQKKAIEKQMAGIATAMTKAIKKALKIKSPSQLMADQVGAMVPAGVMAGMADGQGALDTAMAEMVQPPARSTTVPGVAGPRQAAPLMTGNVTTVRIEFAGAEEAKRFIRGIVRKDGRGSVQRAFGQGKEQTA